MGFAAESLRRLSLPGAAGQLASAVSALDAFVARSSNTLSAMCESAKSPTQLRARAVMV